MAKVNALSKSFFSSSCVIFGIMLCLGALVNCGGNDNHFFSNRPTEKTESGLKYQFYEHHQDGRKLQIGELVDFQLMVQNYQDSVLSNQTFKEYPFEKNHLPGKPYFKEIFEKVAEGDSLVFWIHADSLAYKSGYIKTPAIPSGTEIKFTLKVKKIQSKLEIKNRLEQQFKEQREIDKQLIEETVSQWLNQDSTLQFKSTPSGIKYYLSNEGSGNQPSMGDTVSVSYTSKLLDGTVYDRSEAPTDFVLGHMPVKLDEGILAMHEGAKGTFILPSELGYGTQTMGGIIPPNAILVFDIELIEIK